jgi:hypothetical protein
MSFDQQLFRQELRQLIKKRISPSSSLDDYVHITTELDDEKARLNMEAEKLPYEE